MVAFGHVRGLYFVGIADVENPTLATKAFYLMAGLQHEGVVAFFVVSGFLVGGGALQAFQECRFSMARYTVNRTSRIYIVYLPALVLGALFSEMGIWLLSDTRFYSEVPLFPSGVGQGWNWADAPCHAIVLQRVYCNVAPFNPPLWSLGFEWWLYFAFPMLLFPLFIAARTGAKCMLFVAVVCLLVTLSPTWRLWIEWPVYWFAGVVAAYLHRTRPSPVVLGWVALVVALAMLPLSRLHVVPLRATDAVLAAGLAIALSVPAICQINILPRLMRYGANFSYSMYVVHLPAALLFAGILERFAGFPPTLSQPGLQTFGAFVVTIVVVLVVSDLLSHVTERKTTQVRDYLMIAFGVNKPRGR